MMFSPTRSRNPARLVFPAQHFQAAMRNRQADGKPGIEAQHHQQQRNHILDGIAVFSGDLEVAGLGAEYSTSPTEYLMDRNIQPTRR